MDFDFEEIWEEHKLLVILVVVLIIGGIGAYFYMGHGGEKAQPTQTPAENYDYLATTLPNFMTIMGNIMNNNTVSMPVGATKVYAYGYIATVVVNGQSTSVVDMETVSLFMSGKSDPSNYILMFATGSNENGMVSYFKVNGETYLYASINGSTVMTTVQSITGVAIDSDFFNYTGANAALVTGAGTPFLQVFKTEGNTVYMWYFGGNRIVYDVTVTNGSTTTETLLYVQVQAPDDMWAEQPLG